MFKMIQLWVFMKVVTKRNRMVLNMATLKANKRTDFKRSTLQKIRHSGHVPGVIYGKIQTTLLFH